MKPISFFFLFSLLLSVLVKASAPVPYTGKISIRGENYFGEAQFRFSLHDGQGTTYWQNGEGSDDTIQVAIRNGRYHVLLGGQGMTPLPPELFLEHEELYLRVEFKLEEGDDLQHLAPDQVITATPRALVAEWAKMAKVSERVSPGAITRSMLSEDVLADLNKTGVTAEPSTPPPSAESSISLDMLASDVKAELNATIGRSRLSADVLAALNKTINRERLSADVRADLNRTITKNMLGQDVLSDLNRTVTYQDLSSQVRNDLNRTITKSMLSQEVLNELNATIGPSKLSSEVRNALKPVVVGQPSSVVEVGGNPAFLAVDVDGVNLSYQWKKDGVDIAGATNHSLSIADLNASQHDGNYTVEVSNAFGSVTSSIAQIDVNGSLTEGLVGWWKFDETDGDVTYDSSGNGNNGNLTNGPAWVEGKIGGALSFDGVDDFVQLGNILNSMSDLTFSSWVNVKSTTRDHNMILFKNLIYGFTINNDGLVHFNVGNGTSWGNGGFEGASLDLNKWYSISSSRENALLKIFIDGVLSAESSSDAVGSNTFSFNIGGTWGFHGLIDDVRIYDRALSAFEVKALYELGEQPVQERGSGTTTVVNGTVADGTITKSMLSQEVLNELNSSSGGGGVVPGSLLAVPANQSAPSGYSLYQSGEPKDLVWEEKAPVSVARFAYDGVEVLGGKIYFVGGKDGSSAKNIAERYDPGSNTWESLANMSAARIGVACAVLEGKLYAIGGVGLTSVEVFDPSNDSWSAGVALPSEVYSRTAIMVDGKIYLIGGENASGQITNQVLSFDPSTSQWSAKANMPTGRKGMKLVWFENRIWAIGGSADGMSNKAESYDPATDSWQAEASLTTARSWPVAWVANGRIYVGGGKDGSYLNSIEVYDPATKQWTSAGNLPEVNWAADAVVLNDKAYVVAGQTSADVFSNKVFAADLNASVSGVFDLYRKDGNASSGVPTVQAEVADGSITTTQLSEQILKYLKPEITAQPQAQTVYSDSNHTFSVNAEGKYLTYQWKKNGANLAGETNVTLTITDANATQHDGNYTVVVSNDFGSVESEDMEVVISFWTPSVITALKLWLDANDTSSITLGSGKVSAWNDKSGNSKNATQSAVSARPTFLTNSVSFDGVDDKLEFPALGLSGDASVVFAFNVLSDDGYSVLTGSGSDHWDRFNVDQRSYPGHFRSLRIETLSLNFPTSGEQILAYLADSAGPKYEIRLNGSNVFQSTDSFSFADNIGILGGNVATAFKGTIMEVVAIDDYSTEVVQRLEGYLAGKWGLLNNLPNDHPYK